MIESKDSAIQTEGGSVVGESVKIENGDFIGRDQINITVIIPPNANSSAAQPHEKNLCLINFTRPLTFTQRKHIEELVDKRIGTIIDVAVSFDNLRSFAAQCVAILDLINLSRDEWQTVPIVVNLPGFSPGAACLLSELHGRMGHFPAIVRLSPQSDSNPTEFVVAEVINLQNVRNNANRRMQSAQPKTKISHP